MNKSILVGQSEIAEAHSRSGRIIDACARLEEAISYLEWQLTAFAYDKNNPNTDQPTRQAALRAERGNWDKWAQLEARLGRVTKAFENVHVKTRVAQDAQLVSLRRDWEDIRERVRTLGRMRNDIVHTTVQWSDGQVFRQIGRPWRERLPVNEAEESTLWSDLGKMANEVSQYAMRIAVLLPFADDDQIDII